MGILHIMFKVLKLNRLEIYPTKIERFQARLLDAGEADAKWVRQKIQSLSEELGTKDARIEEGKQGRVIIDLA